MVRYFFGDEKTSVLTSKTPQRPVQVLIKCTNWERGWIHLVSFYQGCPKSIPPWFFWKTSVLCSFRLIPDRSPIHFNRTVSKEDYKNTLLAQYKETTRHNNVRTYSLDTRQLIKILVYLSKCLILLLCYCKKLQLLFKPTWLWVANRPKLL